MKVYHGSYTAIEDIDLSKSIPNKDFGKGFYVTKYRQHAESWAKAMGKKHKTEGFVTEFNLDEQTATDRFFSSNTFSKLSDREAKLYEKDWVEIYEMLLSELNL